MLVGHYGPALALKGVEKTIPLWVLFVAVQWMDVLWACFVALGIEKFRIVPGFTATNALDLYDMPYTHSLPGSLALSVLLGAIVAAFYRVNRARVTAGSIAPFDATRSEVAMLQFRATVVRADLDGCIVTQEAGEEFGHSHVRILPTRCWQIYA